MVQAKVDARELPDKLGREDREQHHERQQQQQRDEQQRKAAVRLQSIARMTIAKRAVHFVRMDALCMEQPASIKDSTVWDVCSSWTEDWSSRNTAVPTRMDAMCSHQLKPPPPERPPGQCVLRCLLLRCVSNSILFGNN